MAKRGAAIIPKVATFGPIRGTSDANGNPKNITKAKVTLDATTIADINNFRFSVGVADKPTADIEKDVEWQDVPHDTFTILTNSGTLLWLRIVGKKDQITIPDRSTANKPIKVEIA